MPKITQACHGSREWGSARARKVDHRREKRRRRSDQGALRNLRQYPTRNEEYSFTIADDDSAGSCLFEEVKQLVEVALYNRRKINKNRKRAALRQLLKATKLTVQRYRKNGASIRIESSEHDDFYVPVREDDCGPIDFWHWFIKREGWEQQYVFKLMEQFETLAFAELRSIFDKGGVTHDCPRSGAVLIKRKNGYVLSHVLKPLDQDASSQAA